VILQEEDLRLRPVELPDDLDAAESWYRDPEVLIYSQAPGTPPMERERVERMYRYQASKGEFYIIEVAVDGRWHPIGDVGLEPDTMPIVIGDAAWRSRGIGRRVLRLLIRRAESLGWPSLQAKYIWPENERSRRLFVGAGFRLTETGVDEHGALYERYRLDLSPIKGSGVGPAD
jgi:RimJ/RimL family protein N-acetyltransferase